MVTVSSSVMEPLSVVDLEDSEEDLDLMASPTDGLRSVTTQNSRLLTLLMTLTRSLLLNT